MPRTSRDSQPDTIYHIIDRGVERRDIFLNDGDYSFFLARMTEAFDKFKVRLLSWCLMPNHFHLEAAPSAVPLGVPMHLLLTSYAHYLNSRLGRIGHLFQDRFKAIPCLDLPYFVRLAGYINLNPVRAGLVNRPEDWKWSSHSELLSGAVRRLDLSDLPALIGMDEKAFRLSYREEILKVAQKRQGTLDELIREAAAFTGLTVAQLSSGGKGSSFTHAKRLLLQWGLESGLKVSQIARGLNCTTQSLYMLRDD
jgi:REP element-mobilizing transposase RayT